MQNTFKLPAARTQARLPRRPSAISQVFKVMQDEQVRIEPPNYSRVSISSEGLAFGTSDRFRLSVARQIEQRLRAWALAYSVYLEKGYAAENDQKLWYGLHDALHETVTFLAEREQQTTAALTVVFDSPLGLPADNVFGDLIDVLREAGRRPCELVSLVSIEEQPTIGAELIKRLFKMAYLTARRQQDATDFVITVNPRHVSYYERCMLFERIGPDRDYGKVNGAPATPLRLNLLTAEEHYKERYGHLSGDRNLYRFFINDDESEILNWLSAERGPLDEESLRRYFLNERPLLSAARAAERHHLHEQYLAYDLISA